jgi:hypothetical protein
VQKSCCTPSSPSDPKDSDPFLEKKDDNEEAEASSEAGSIVITKDEEIEYSSIACCRIYSSMIQSWVTFLFLFF